MLNNNVEFDSLSIKLKFAKRSDSKVKKDKENISGLPNSREMVKWLSERKKIKFRKYFSLKTHFVVAYVKDHHKKGYIDLQMWKIQ